MTTCISEIKTPKNTNTSETIVDQKLIGETEKRTESLLHHISPLTQNPIEDEHLIRLINLGLEDTRFPRQEGDKELIERISKKVLKSIKPEERAELIDQAVALNKMVVSKIAIIYYIHLLKQHSKEERAELLNNLDNYQNLSDDVIHTLLSLPPQDRVSFTTLPKQLFNKLDNEFSKSAHVVYHLLPKELRTPEKLGQVKRLRDCREYCEAIRNSFAQKLAKSNKEHYAPFIPDNLLKGPSGPSSFLEDMFKFALAHPEFLPRK